MVLFRGFGMKSVFRWLLILAVTAGLGISYSWAEIFVQKPFQYRWSTEIEGCDFVKMFAKMAVEVTKREGSLIYYDLVSREADGNQVEIKINNCKLAKVSKEAWRYPWGSESAQFKFSVNETEIVVNVPEDKGTSSKISRSMPVRLTIKLETYNIPRTLLEDLYQSLTIQSLEGEMTFYGYGISGEIYPSKPEDIYSLKARITAKVLNGILLAY